MDHLSGVVREMRRKISSDVCIRFGWHHSRVVMRFVLMVLKRSEMVKEVKPALMMTSEPVMKRTRYNKPLFLCSILW